MKWRGCIITSAFVSARTSGEYGRTGAFEGKRVLTGYYALSEYLYSIHSVIYANRGRPAEARCIFTGSKLSFIVSRCFTCARSRSSAQGFGVSINHGYTACRFPRDIAP